MRRANISPRCSTGIPLRCAATNSGFRRAIAEGATKLRGVEDQFYGDRSGSFEDPFCHRWYVATHIEDVPPEEMAERSAKVMNEL